MTTCLGKVSIVNFYQFVCLLLSLLVLRMGFDCIFPDHSFLLTFHSRLKNNYIKIDLNVYFLLSLDQFPALAFRNTTVEHQRLEHLWDHENMFETGVVRANEC